MKRNKKPGWGMFFAALTVISSSLLADALKGEHLFAGWSREMDKAPWPLVWMFFSLILFVFAVYQLYRHKNDFISVKSLSQSISEPHSCLIILLTKPNIKPALWKFPLVLVNKEGNNIIIEGKNIRDDINELDKLSLTKEYWNWQQLLRGIEPHVKVKRIVLIGSNKDERGEGSFEMLENARQFIMSYLPFMPENGITLYKNPIDFESYDEVVDTIHEVIKQLQQEQYSAKDIIVDITGGQKTASIAAASITFQSEVTFQYVRTSSKYNDTRDVLSYNVINQSSGAF